MKPYFVNLKEKELKERKYSIYFISDMKWCQKHNIKISIEKGDLYKEKKFISIKPVYDEIMFFNPNTQMPNYIFPSGKDVWCFGESVIPHIITTEFLQKEDFII